MQANPKTKEQARELRKQGKSLGWIARQVGVAKSTVSLWCRDLALTDEQKALLVKTYDARMAGARANKSKREAQIVTVRTLAKLEIDPLDPTDLKRLKDIGTVLYWAEGGKRKRSIDMTNSDPEIMRIAMLWFREICHVPEERFRVAIYYHYNQNEDKIKRYWSEVTGIPLSQFHKSIFKKEGTGHRKRVLHHGTCKVRVGDADLLHRVLAWIEQLHLPVYKTGQ
jgi:hypothetical protein